MVIAFPLAIIALSMAFPLTINALELGKSVTTLGGRPIWSAFSKSADFIEDIKPSFPTWGYGRLTVVSCEFRPMSKKRYKQLLTHLYTLTKG
jgi:hypothetical protein